MTRAHRLVPMVLLVHCPASVEGDLLEALTGEGFEVVHSSWEGVSGMARSTSARLAIVWPDRHDIDPRVPSVALGVLLANMKVLLMLRAAEGELTDSLKPSGAWILNEGSKLETIVFIARHLLVGHRPECADAGLKVER